MTPTVSGELLMANTVSSYQSGAQIALKLLGAGAASGRVPSRAETASAAQIKSAQTKAAQTRAALDKATHSSGTKIILSAQTAIDYFGPGSDIAKAASLGDQVEVTTSGLDVPQDKAAFRQQVLSFLKSDAGGYDDRYPEQADFIQALKDGKDIVKTADETPELNWQPNVGWTIYKDGYSQGGGVTGGGAANQQLLDAMSATQGQSTGYVGSHMFYAYFEK